jgi:hypothetical protein
MEGTVAPTATEAAGVAEDVVKDERGTGAAADATMGTAEEDAGSATAVVPFTHEPTAAASVMVMSASEDVCARVS